MTLLSPAASAAAIGRLHSNMVEVFEQTIRGRLKAVGRDAETAGPLAAAIGGVVGHVYSRWVTSGGRGSLAPAFDAALDALGELVI